jgi:hypothetical protein
MYVLFIKETVIQDTTYEVGCVCGVEACEDAEGEYHMTNESPDLLERRLKESDERYILSDDTKVLTKVREHLIPGVNDRKK